MPEDRRHKVEGYWDCQYCGTQGIPGRFRSCTSCGHPRDASVKFYTKDIDASHAITEEEFKRQQAEAEKNSRSDSANYGGVTTTEAGSESLYAKKEGSEAEKHDDSDWYCDFCDSYNPAELETCKFCGAARSDTSGQTYRDRMGKVARTYDSHGNLVSERDLAKKQEKPTVAAEPPKQGGCLRFVILGIIAVLLIGIVGRCVFSPKAKKMEVASFDWAQTIEIEEYKTVSESDWSLPEGARLDHKSQEIQSYNRVLDHYEKVPYQVSEKVFDHYETYTTEVDNGDGTFDVEEHDEPVYRTEQHTEYRDEPVYKDVPIYGTKYYYEIDKWVHTRDVETSGKDHEPYYGEVKLAKATGANGIGEEREGARYGTYGFTNSKGKHFTADYDFWEYLEEGDEIEVQVDSNNHVTAW